MRVLQLIDSLEIGGAERMAVNYANALHNRIEFSALCTTRSEGPLQELINPEVPYLFLERRRRLDLAAVFRLKRFIKLHKIEIIQAHGSSYFIATLVKLITPELKLIWHDHYGNSEFLRDRKTGYLKIFSKWFDVVFTVNEKLAIWSNQTFKVEKTFYIKNFISEALTLDLNFKISGAEGKRIVCVANLRPQKNHRMLLDAFKEVLKQDSEYTLHLFGNAPDTTFASQLLKDINRESFRNHIFYYGTHLKMSAILPRFDIGVLSSNSEGLPLALLEYAQAGIPVITTDVGQCRAVVGDLGKLFPAQNSVALASAILESDLKNTAIEEKPKKLRNKIINEYGEQTVMQDVISKYAEII